MDSFFVILILGDYMIIDYDRKMEVVLDFYEQAQEILSMVHDDIKGFHYLYGFDLMSDEISDFTKDTYIIDIEKKVAARKKQLLIQCLQKSLKSNDL